MQPDSNMLFLEHHVETIDDLMALSLNDLSNMDGIGSETIRLLVKKLSCLGIEYYPVVHDKESKFKRAIY